VSPNTFLPLCDSYLHLSLAKLDLGLLEVSKKPEKQIKSRKQKKINRKNQIEKKKLNRLENPKEFLVRFGFGFKCLKPIEPE
jgi:hypothetical protein